MSSISNILNIATSGLAAAQAQVNTTSDNIANVNTPGYARKIVKQSETVVGGQGLGVHVDTITRAANAFLQKASLSASAGSGSAAAISNFLDQAQQLFGDPSSSTSFFGALDSVYSAFSSAAATPASNLSRTNALHAVNTFLSNAASVASSLGGLADEANKQASADVATINGILSQISSTNGDIARISVAGGDASGLQNTQSQLLDQLSSLIQVQTQPNATGGVTIRSNDGVYLAGDQGAATLTYSTSGAGALLTATAPKGLPMQITAGSGEIAGLMHTAGVDLPQIQSQFSELITQAVSQLNAAHNASTTVPAPQVLTGVATGVTLPTALTGFNGKTSIAVTNAAGVMQTKVDIAFTNGSGTMTVGGVTTGFSPTTFLTTLNTALGSSATANFAGGVLSIGAASGQGVVIADDPTTPSNNAGMGFSQYFGLNNLIQSSVYAQTNTAVTGATTNTFSPGGFMSLQLTDSTGAALRQVNLTVPASATTVGDLITALNTSAGAYGSFNLDAQGHLAFTPNGPYAGTTVSVIADNTLNSAAGPTLSQFLGIGVNTQAARASSFSLRSDIAADPSKLALAQLDTTQAVGGGSALAAGDGRGAQALADAGSAAVMFSAAGALKATRISVSDYASQFSGQVGAAASSADSAAKTAAAVQTQAAAQRSAVEGVNLDTELVNLTTFQQSYNASARLVQAAKDMYDTLLQLL